MLSQGNVILPLSFTAATLVAGVFPVVISQSFALALTVYTVATQLLLYYVRSIRYDHLDHTA